MEELITGAEFEGLEGDPGSTDGPSFVVVTTGGLIGWPLSFALKNATSEGTLPASIQRRSPFRTRSILSREPSAIHSVIWAKCVSKTSPFASTCHISWVDSVSIADHATSLTGTFVTSSDVAARMAAICRTIPLATSPALQASTNASTTSD